MPTGPGWAGPRTRPRRAPLSRDVPDWLVMDHYALDARWMRAACPAGTRRMVIDDLADRPHDCDLLLDQNLGHIASDYDGLVPDSCTRLMGPRYALLRPEFAERRAAALAARADRGLQTLMISMGGIDAPDATSTVLGALRDAPLPLGLRISVIMGARAPALETVRALAQSMPRPTEVAVDVDDMAARMAAADLAIGAGGGTTWERCCPRPALDHRGDRREPVRHRGRPGPRRGRARPRRAERPRFRTKRLPRPWRRPPTPRGSRRCQRPRRGSAMATGRQECCRNLQPVTSRSSGPLPGRIPGASGSGGAP